MKNAAVFLKEKLIILHHGYTDMVMSKLADLRFHACISGRLVSGCIMVMEKSEFTIKRIERISDLSKILKGYPRLLRKYDEYIKETRIMRAKKAKEMRIGRQKRELLLISG